MHEATIAQSILQILSEKLLQICPSGQIVKARLLIGEFRNIDVDSLSFSFDTLKKFHLGISSCNLEFETIPTEAVCQKENHIYHPTFENTFLCEQCQSGIGKIIRGEELDLVGTTILSSSMENDQHA